MNVHSWWTFVFATFCISATPGPNMLMMMTSSVRHGMRRTYFTMAGCYLALLLILTASSAGLGALLTMNPPIFNMLRCVGALYLIYLGIQAWRVPVTMAPDASATPAKPATAYEAFRRGFFVGISNPKAILFAGAFFPQFINQGAPEFSQFMILLLTFSVIELGWYFVYASGGNSLSGFMQRDKVQKAFNHFTGGLFTVFGLLLLCVRSN